MSLTPPMAVPFDVEDSQYDSLLGDLSTGSLAVQTLLSPCTPVQVPLDAWLWEYGDMSDKILGYVLGDGTLRSTTAWLFERGKRDQTSRLRRWADLVLFGLVSATAGRAVMRFLRTQPNCNPNVGLAWWARMLPSFFVRVQRADAAMGNETAMAGVWYTDKRRRSGPTRPRDTAMFYAAIRIGHVFPLLQNNVEKLEYWLELPSA